MDIKQAKQELRQTIRAYTARTEDGVWRIPREKQRPVLLMGPPGIGKTAILSQLAQEEHVGLVCYTMTHHTRQSALGLPVIVDRTAAGRQFRATEYTMSEIIASVYAQMEKTGLRTGILFLDEINCVSETLMPAILQMLQNKTFGVHALPEGWMIARRAIRRAITSPRGALIWRRSTGCGVSIWSRALLSGRNTLPRTPFIRQCWPISGCIRSTFCLRCAACGGKLCDSARVGGSVCAAADL